MPLSRALRSSLAPAAPLLVAALAVLAAPGSAARAQSAEAPRDPLLGAPLVIGDEPVADVLVQRELLLGPARAVLERAIDAWTIESELLQRAQQRALAAHGSPDAEGYDAAFAEALAAERAAIEPGPEALAAARQRALDALVPELVEPTEEALGIAVLWRWGSAEELDRELASELRFDATFLPEDPGAWPEITQAAFQSTPGTARLRDIALRAWRASEHARRSGLESKNPVAAALEAASHREVVRGVLRPWMGVAIADDPSGAVLASADLDADGTPDLVARVDALWEAARDLVTVEDVELAKRWLATERVVRARLVEDGALSGDGPGAGAGEADDEADGPARRAPDGFSPEARARYSALRAAFVDARGADALADAELLARARSALGNARVHAELMLFPVVDVAARAWPAGARERGRARAAEVLARLSVVDAAWRAREPIDGKPANPGALWREELATNGDLEERIAVRRAPGVVPQLLRGVLGSHTHAQLQESFGEDARWRFVNDASLADRVFAIEPGAFGGPWDGRFGVALARGTAFQEARREAPEEQVRAWALDRAFEEYARDARAAVRIEGLR